MAGRATYQMRYHNKIAIYAVLGVLFTFAVVLIVNCNSLNDKKEKLLSEYTEVEEMLAMEEQETLDLQELEKESKTKKFYEQIARERCGMVYKDEIVFKEGN